MKREELEKPTKHGIAMLLKELAMERSAAYLDPAIAAISEQIETRREHLLKDSLLRKLEEKKDAMETAFNAKKNDRSKKVQRVRRRYYAHGLTPAVLRDIQALVAEFES